MLIGEKWLNTRSSQWAFVLGDSMANRNTLSVNKIDDFKVWLEKDGWQLQETKGFYEVLRAVKQGRKHPFA